MLVLDAGAGRSPYRKLFDHAKYEAADFAQLSSKYAALDYVCDLTAIPVEDDRFDRIICNQVLEHLPEPGAALAELNRVLKPGGRILLTAPLYFSEHQVPYDFYRYTRYSLRRLFEHAGFQIDSIDWLEGYFGTMSYAFRQMFAALPRNVREVRRIERGWRLVYLAPLLLGTRWLARVLHTVYFHADVRWKYTRRGMAKNYLVLAHKPA
jgi:SAM-dependent methyltransferase